MIDLKTHFPLPTCERAEIARLTKSLEIFPYEEVSKGIVGRYLSKITRSVQPLLRSESLSNITLEKKLMKINQNPLADKVVWINRWLFGSVDVHLLGRLANTWYIRLLKHICALPSDLY